MELLRTGKVLYQIQYDGIGISKVTQHTTVKSAEDELRFLKDRIKKEDLKDVMKNIKVYRIEELDIINLGKNLDK